MATFDAGAIEATLTLDRSPFQEGLRLAKAEAAQMSDKKIEVGLDLTGEERLTLLAARINELDGQTISINLDADGAAELLLLQREIKELDGQNIDVNVDTGAAQAELGALAATLASIKGMGAIEGPGIMLSAIALLAPIAAAAILPLAGLLGGIASAFFLVGAGAGVLALGFIPVIKGFAELQKEIKKAATALNNAKPGTEDYEKKLRVLHNLQEQLKEQYGPMATGMGNLSAAWGKFKDAVRPEIVEFLGRGMTILASILPHLVPLFDAFFKVLSPVLDRIDAWVKGGGLDRFVAFLSREGPTAMTSMIGIFGGLGATIVHVLEAFAPFANELLGGFAQIVQGWSQASAHMGASDGFKTFMETVHRDGPAIWKVLVDVGGAVVKLVEALIPLAPPALAIVDAFAKVIKNTPTPVLTAILAVAIPLVLGLQALAAILPLVEAAFFALDVVMAANPIGLVVIAIAALVAGMVIAYQKSEVFRAFVLAAWEEVKVGAYGLAWVVLTVFKWITQAWLEAVGGLINGAAAAFGWVPGVGDKLKKAADTFNGFKDTALGTIDGLRDGLKAKMDESLRNTQIQSDLLAIAVTKPLKDRLPAYIDIANKYGLTLPEVLDKAHLPTGQKSKALGMAAAMGLTDSKSEMQARSAAIAKVPRIALQDEDTRTAAIAAAMGRHIGEGLIQGMARKEAAVAAAAAGLGHGAVQAIARGADLGSPSKTAIKHGQHIGDGLIIGLRRRRAAILAMAHDIGASAADALGAMTVLTDGPTGPDGRGQGTIRGMATPSSNKTIKVSLTAYNPVAETTSETAVKETTRLAELGVFE